MANGNNKGKKPQRKPIPIWWFIAAMFAMILFSNYIQRGKSTIPLDYSEFLEEVERGQIAEVVFRGEDISGEFIEERTFGEIKTKKFKSYGPYDAELRKQLSAKKVKFSSEPSANFLTIWGPTLLFLLVIIWFWRRQMGGGGMFGGGGGAFGFGKSQPRVSVNDTRVTFKDVAGVEEAKEELKEVVEFLKNPARFSRLGAKIPKGVLLMGPPGTGKTLLARAVAGEAEVPFLSLSGSEFVEMFVGVGAARVRDLFKQAKTIAAHKPCIIFIDEIDAMGRHRGAGLGGGHDEKEQTLNQLFVEMDGFEANSGIVMMAATNRPDVLDPALLRPGRFDRHVTVGFPDLNGREAILKVHTRDKVLASDIDLRVIARGTPGFSGADLANLVNEAALLAGRLGKLTIEMVDFEAAKDRILMGLEKKGFKMTEHERLITAFHEAGHTIAAKMLPGADPVHKVSIIPRGRALGVTCQLPEEDRYLMQKSQALSRIVILMAGRAAEMFRFKEPSSGAQNDIEVATEMARKMVCDWGMSEGLGPVKWSDLGEEVFLGRQIVQSQGCSQETSSKIDAEKKKILETGLREAQRIIKENPEKFETLVKALLEKEVLDEEEINAIFA